MDFFDRKFNIHVEYIHARQRFISKLKDITDPEQKRKIIGTEFIRVFEEESRRLGPFDYLAQGTLYPDVIESAGTNVDPKTGERVAVKIKRVQLRQSIFPLALRPSVCLRTSPILHRATVNTMSETALQRALSQMEISNSQKIDFMSPAVF